MSSERRKIAIFGCGFTSRYREGLCRAFNTAAEELNADVYYFNSLGNIGNINAQYGAYEFELPDYIDLSGYDGIVFDGEGYNVDGIGDKVIEKLRTAKCPVISISSYVEGFYNIEFDDTGALRNLIEHFIDVHHFTRIGFMSGYLSHPDAQARLALFRQVMKEHGMPEDGAGMFEGDFWFHKGEEAADYFLSQKERPEAVVCANDYMAIALTIAFKRKGIRVPEDIAVSGFDGTLEAKEYMPHITTATRERLDIARKSLRLLLGKDKIKKDRNLHIMPQCIYTQSCGCMKVDYAAEVEHINDIHEINRSFTFSVYDAESSLLKLNKVENIRELEKVFAENSINFGAFTSFFMMLHTDAAGRFSIDSDYIAPSGKFSPVIWVDKNGEYSSRLHSFTPARPIPETNADRPHFYYIMSVHCAERMFGYAVIEMEDKDIFNEFYNVWLLNMALTLEVLLKNDRINKLIGTLKNLSIRDGLTGMLNRRGFDTLSREAIGRMRGRKKICTMVIDMDGLKRINDEYGHSEGDRAIKAAADIITRCCDSGEIAARAGGDEFYIFVSDYSEEQLERFVGHLEDYTASFNETGLFAYPLSMSLGSYLIETDSTGRLEDFLKISDQRMYEKKQSKPGRRKS